MLEKKSLAKPRKGYVGIGGKGPPSAESSRSGSPHTSAPSPASFIPQPKGTISRERIGLDKNRSRPSSTSSTSSIPHLPGKLPLGSNSSLGKGLQSSTTGRNLPTASNNANSMLDKLKLFHGKDKAQPERIKVTTSSNKRTSSSSGFSSARSERSDSSTSICSESKTSTETKENLTSPSSISKPSHITTSGSSIPAKSQVKKLGTLPTTKQLVSKARTVDGKDPVSSKIDQLKSASRIAKEKRNEKLLKSASSDNSNSPSESSYSLSNSLKNQTRSLPVTNSELKPKKDDDPAQYTTIEPDNPVRQSKVVANLKDKAPSIPNSASQNTAVSPSIEKILMNTTNTIVTSNSVTTMDGNTATSQNTNSVLMPSPGSSIPKPTAAVKGTSKVVKDEKHQPLNETSSSTNSKHNLQEKQLQGTKLSRDEIYVAVHIAGPDTQVLDTGQQQNESRVSNLPKNDRNRSDSRSGSQSNVSIAMVSPIMSSAHKREKTPPEIMSEKGQQSKTISSKSNSNSDHISSPSLRTNPEPIYEACEKMHHGSNASTIAEESDDVVLNIKPMQPLLRASPYGYMRGLGPLASSRSTVTTRMHSSLRVHADYGETGRFASSRQFLASLDNARMYGIAMKRALSGCNSLVDADYGHDMDSFDASGYMSDGEILRPGVTFKSDDISSGYLSEGGTPVYTRKNIARPPKEGAVIGKETRIINVLQDDRNVGLPHRPLHRLGFDDSSSVSSEVSDTFPELSTDENLTGSSLSSDYNVYGSLKRSATGPRIASSTHSHPGHKVNATCENRNRKVADEHPTYVASSSTGGGSGKAKQAHVKKTDSSMQTESSAFQQVSSSAWKKYMLQQQQQMPSAHESTSGKNSPSDKAKDKKSQKSDSSKKSSIAESHRSSKQHKLVGRSGVDSELSKSLKAGSCESLTSGNGRKVSRSSVVQATTQQQAAAAASLKRQNAQAQYYGCNGAALTTTSNSKATGSGAHRSSSSGVNKTSADKLTEQASRNDSDSIMTTSQCFSRPPPGALVPPNAPPSNLKSVTDQQQQQQQRKGKVKVCANTQTNSSDLAGVHSDGEYSSLSRGGKYPPKQYFMTTPGPGTGLKERVYGTRSVLNGSPTPMSDYAMLSARTPRLSAPLRDLDNYASLDHGGVGAYSWMRHSPSCGTSVNSSGIGNRAATLTEADSMESLSSTSSSIHAQIQHARANSLTHARLMLHQRELAASPRLSRSNSIRSTKSEKLPSYLLQRSSDDPEASHNSTSHYQQPTNNGVTNAQNGSQPTSPSSAPQTTGRYMFPLSPGAPSLPTSTNSSNHINSRCSMSPYMTGLLSKMNNKDDEIHGSALSLVSTSSSIYSTAEEKQAHEIRKLKRELDQAHEKVTTLTSQLTTNAHMVAAFEQSLSNMTNRLQHLTATAEQKDSELMELRKTIEALKKQSAEAGLTKMALQSMQAVQRTLQEHRISRQFSTDSVSSVNSLSSACSGNSGQSNDPMNNKKKKKKGWLRSSFSKAFSRSKKNKNGSVSDVEDLRHLQSDSSTPNSPLLGSTAHNGELGTSPQAALKQSHSSSALYDKDDDSAPEVVKELKKQLREKDMILTDIRLDALSSAHQLESLKETVNKMRSEMASLKHDNDRLQRLVSTKSLTSSQSSLPHRTSLESLEKRLSTSEQTASLNLSDIYINESRSDPDGKLVTVSVFLGCHGDISIYKSTQSSEILIGSICITSKTQWDLLDNLVKRTFKEYVLRVDQVSNLGLNAESVITYQVGDVVRSKEADVPELLPFGYIVGDNMNIKIILKGTKQHSVDALTFESVIPKSIVQRYISLLTEHRRIILCGPSGTGKTYVAQKLAEYLVLKNGKELTAGAIATFSVDHKSAKELRQYLSNVAEQCETSNASDLPTVIILDNLHHVGSLGEVFNGFLSAKYQKCPYIIGTMNQATCSTTNLQLHHNFRWVLCANHMEPVKGFLGRFLKRKLIEEEVKNGTQNTDITKVIDWMPKVWQHLNKYLETHSSSDVTIGPRLFLSCPVDLSGSQVWFTDLWNYSIIPYLLEAVREGLQLYGRRAPWEDPADWVYETYPWQAHGSNSNDWPQLLRLRQEDVGYEGHPGPGMGSKTHHSNNTEAEADPLLNMLMRLQEAASYSSPHSNDSDSTSLDSHGSGLHSDELLNSGLESTL